MALREYKRKRDFKKTKEPSDSARSKRQAKSNTRLVFVVQKHLASHLHYDFRLEHRGILKSWAVPKGPPVKAKDKRLAVLVEDHPYAYKDFEGRIPEGEYGAGTVKIWDKGTYEAVTPLDAGLRTGHVTIFLRGRKLKGEYALVRFRGPKNWLLIKSKKKV